MPIAIVTAANDGYFASLQHLIRSLDGINKLGDFTIHVLDVGLTAPQRSTLTQAGHVILNPGWDVDVSPWKGVPEWFKAMTARPFLPNYVKNAEVIVWIDADIWVQDQTMLYDFVRAAQGGSLAVCLELERSYDNMFMRNASRDVYYNNLSKYYGEETANRLIHLPMMNWWTQRNRQNCSAPNIFQCCSIKTNLKKRCQKLFLRCFPPGSSEQYLQNSPVLLWKCLLFELHRQDHPGPPR